MWLGTALVMGCGGGDSEGPPVETFRPECEVKLSGAVSGDPLCIDTTLAYFAAEDYFALTLEEIPGGQPLVHMQPTVNGRPSVGSFTGPSSDVDCGVFVRDGTKAWYAYYEDPRSGVSLRGSCTMNLTQVEEYNKGGSVVTYRFQGTMTAHLVALETSGATGTVDVSMTFSY